MSGIEPRPRLLCVAGPTASGKTALSLALARCLDGEIVSCDSMQVYRGMDIGTAKPSPDERGGIPHHMLDVAEPTEDYSAARYAREADEAIRGVLARGKHPIVAGGTGLYLRALVSGLHDAAPDDGGQSRARFAAYLGERGEDALHALLADADPETAARLSPKDHRRVIRALEVHALTGTPLSEHHRRARSNPPRYETLTLGLRCPDRAELYARIGARVDDMMRRGLLDEVRALLDAGVPAGCTAMQAIGYKELTDVLAGLVPLETAVEDVKTATRRYAKRQKTWFNRQWDVLWLDAGAPNLVAMSTEIAGKYLRL